MEPPWYFDPLPMVYRTPCTWYFDPPIHGFWPSYPWYFDPHTHGISKPLSVLFPTHGILTPPSMIFLPPYPWYIEPPTHGISNPLLLYYEPLLFGRNGGGGQFTMRGFKIRWQKIDHRVNIWYENWPRGQNNIWHQLLGGSVFLIFLFFCVVLLCVFTLWVPSSNIRYDFRIKMMFGSSLPTVVCRTAHLKVFVFVCMSNTYFVFFFSIFLCCQFL